MRKASSITSAMSSRQRSATTTFLAPFAFSISPSRSAACAAFLNLKLENERVSKAICSVAPLTLGVYLIHAHANVSPWLWASLNLPAKMDSASFPLVQLGCVLAIFVLCIIIDAIRCATVGKLENAKKLHLLCNSILNKVSSYL